MICIGYLWNKRDTRELQNKICTYSAPVSPCNATQPCESFQRKKKLVRPTFSVIRLVTNKVQRLRVTTIFACAVEHPVYKYARRAFNCTRK